MRSGTARPPGSSSTVTPTNPQSGKERGSMRKLREINIAREHRTLGGMLRLKAELNGDKIFLKFLDRQYSYRDMHEISNRLARSLQASGIEKGQHVAFMMDNKPELLFLYFAVAKIGGVCVPVNTAAKGELYTYYLTQSDSTFLISDSGLVERFLTVQDQCPDIKRMVIVDDGRPVSAEVRKGLRPEIEEYEALLSAPADDLPNDIVQNSDLAFLLY